MVTLEDLRKIDNRIYQRALSYCKNKDPNQDISLRNTFSWSKTKEGHKFWSYIYEKLNFSSIVYVEQLKSKFPDKIKDILSESTPPIEYQELLETVIDDDIFLEWIKKGPNRCWVKKNRIASWGSYDGDGRVYLNSKYKLIALKKVDSVWGFEVEKLPDNFSTEISILFIRAEGLKEFISRKGSEVKKELTSYASIKLGEKLTAEELNAWVSSGPNRKSGKDGKFRTGYCSFAHKSRTIEAIFTYPETSLFLPPKIQGSGLVSDTSDVWIRLDGLRKFLDDFRSKSDSISEGTDRKIETRILDISNRPIKLGDVITYPPREVKLRKKKKPKLNLNLL